MDRRVWVGVASLTGILLVLSMIVTATTAEMYFSIDKNGQNRVTNIQEGDQIWIVVYDPDENIDCDVRDKVWTDVKIMDPKMGAYIVWVSYDDDNLDANDQVYSHAHYEPFKGHFPGNAGSYDYDYLEETGSDTGLFVSKRAFQVGTRENYDVPRLNTHVVENNLYPGEAWLHDFQFGCFLYFADGLNGLGDPQDGRSRYGGGHFAPLVPPIDWSMVDDPIWPDDGCAGLGNDTQYLVGTFENNDTLVGLYQDQNDPGDVAVAMMKIDDVEATIAWDNQIYEDCNGSARITIEDWDENLNSSKAEYVPVFILLNPGSWNPVQTDSPTNFCALKRTGGVYGNDGSYDLRHEATIRFLSAYHSWRNTSVTPRGAGDDRYYIQYPVANNVTTFDTIQVDGITAVSFYAQETGSNTGVFQLNLNSICADLGFNSLRVRDVLVAYYIDPNDEDDFKLATAYIEELRHSVTSFTNANRADQQEYWIGRDPVYVQVIDANANVDPCCPEQAVVHICDPHEEDDSEWWILNELSSNSPVFFSFAGMQLRPVFDALGAGNNPANTGGYQLQLDNWRLEVYNEDEVYARYNDVYYVSADLGQLGDVRAIGENDTAFPPTIRSTRVANDVSFDLMSIADTQVYDGQTTQMWFLDRQGNRADGYSNGSCVFVEVLDPDQNEDVLRRERIDGYWDGGGNFPFAPENDVAFECDADYAGIEHNINDLLGMVNIFNDGANPKLYVLNPRSGFWSAIDLLETGVSTGDFVSVICIDLVSIYDGCVPTLRALPGDTIIAVYEDPSNHSDSAWISVKVGIGGGSAPSSLPSTTQFVNAAGVDVASYSDFDDVYVKVVDPTHTGMPSIEAAVEIAGEPFDLISVDGLSDAFMTDAIDLDLVGGQQITATYTDPWNPTDTSSDTIAVVASELDVVRFYASPNPFAEDCVFGFEGTGTASVMSVDVYDMSGKIVWNQELTDVAEIAWDGTGENGALLANGAYFYLITATDGANPFHGRGAVFINR